MCQKQQTSKQESATGGCFVSTPPGALTLHGRVIISDPWLRHGAGWCGSWTSSAREISGEGSGLRTESGEPAGIRARRVFLPLTGHIRPCRPNNSPIRETSWASLQFPRKRHRGDDLSAPVAGFSSVTSDSWQRRRSVVPAQTPHSETPPPLPHNRIPSSPPITSF